MNNQVVESTKKFLEGKTLDQFSKEIGIDSSRQAVYRWKEGLSVPSPMTLFAVIASPSSEAWAKAWAGECLAAIQQSTQPTKRVVMVQHADGVAVVDPEFGNK